jgi:hypothetical protein
MMNKRVNREQCKREVAAKLKKKGESHPTMKMKL